MDAFAGLALLERAFLTGHSTDLELGTTRLAESVWGVPIDEPNLEYTIHLLAEAYWRRGTGDPVDRDSVDRCIDTAGRGLAVMARVGPGAAHLLPLHAAGEPGASDDQHSE
jgi:hypothetical protein